MSKKVDNLDVLTLKLEMLIDAYEFKIKMLELEIKHLKEIAKIAKK